MISLPFLLQKMPFDTNMGATNMKSSICGKHHFFSSVFENHVHQYQTKVRVGGWIVTMQLGFSVLEVFNGRVFSLGLAHDVFNIISEFLYQLRNYVEAIIIDII